MFYGLMSERQKEKWKKEGMQRAGLPSPLPNVLMRGPAGQPHTHTHTHSQAHRHIEAHGTGTHLQMLSHKNINRVLEKVQMHTHLKFLP